MIIEAKRREINKMETWKKVAVLGGLYAAGMGLFAGNCAYRNHVREEVLSEYGNSITRNVSPTEVYWHNVQSDLKDPSNDQLREAMRKKDLFGLFIVDMHDLTNVWAEKAKQSRPKRH